MKRIRKAIYMTPAELDQRILERTVEAHKHPEGSPMCQEIMQEIGSLRIYADAKRWIDSPSLKPAR